MSLDTDNAQGHQKSPQDHPGLPVAAVGIFVQLVQILNMPKTVLARKTPQMYKIACGHLQG